MFPFPVASLTTMESNQRVNFVGLGQVQLASWCRVLYSRLLLSDLYVDVRLGYQQFNYV